jgi:hypothetical protein
MRSVRLHRPLVFRPIESSLERAGSSKRRSASGLVLCGHSGRDRRRTLHGVRLEFIASALRCEIVMSDLLLEIAEFAQRETHFGGRLCDGQAAITLHGLIDGDVFFDLIGRNLGVLIAVVLLCEYRGELARRDGRSRRRMCRSQGSSDRCAEAEGCREGGNQKISHRRWPAAAGWVVHRAPLVILTFGEMPEKSGGAIAFPHSMLRF